MPSEAWKRCIGEHPLKKLHDIASTDYPELPGELGYRIPCIYEMGGIEYTGEFTRVLFGNGVTANRVVMAQPVGAGYSASAHQFRVVHAADGGGGEGSVTPAGVVLATGTSGYYGWVLSNGYAEGILITDPGGTAYTGHGLVAPGASAGSCRLWTPGSDVGIPMLFLAQTVAAGAVAADINLRCNFGVPIT